MNLAAAVAAANAAIEAKYPFASLSPEEQARIIEFNQQWDLMEKRAVASLVDQILAIRERIQMGEVL